jgi:hypothetical protein
LEKEPEVMPKQTRRLHKLTTDGGSRGIPATISPAHANIARLAYLHWLDRGCPIGSPEEDWSQAEQDLKNKQTQTA